MLVSVLLLMALHKDGVEIKVTVDCLKLQELS